MLMSPDSEVCDYSFLHCPCTVAGSAEAAVYTDFSSWVVFPLIFFDGIAAIFQYRRMHVNSTPRMLHYFSLMQQDPPPRSPALSP